jgi:hypothetical protein
MMNQEPRKIKTYRLFGVPVWRVERTMTEDELEERTRVMCEKFMDKLLDEKMTLRDEVVELVLDQLRLAMLGEAKPE